MTRFASRILLLSSIIAASTHLPQPLQAMGDVSFPTLTFPAAETVTQDSVVLLPAPTDAQE